VPTDNYERAALIDIPTAAVRLGMSISTVRRKIRTGELSAYHMGGPAAAPPPSRCGVVPHPPL
jgi:hypothetical protein